ncbi:saccharopine dehydrogenase, partial [Corallococcus aberystwythensis]
MESEGRVVLVGGYGVVGAQLALLLRERHPDLPLLIAGRREAPARELAARLGRADGVALDVRSPQGWA